MTIGDKIIVALYIGLVLFFAVTVIYKFSNELPDGRRGVKKFVKKVNIIQDANQAIKNVVYVSHKGILFRVWVNKVEVPKGLEYETIPMYTCRSVFINDEEVVRVHKIHRVFRDKCFLEFTSNRKLTEIVDIISAAYIPAREVYEKCMDEKFSLDRKSFYPKDKTNEKDKEGDS